ncbi:MAG: IS200/IS605 family element transposase accessory protein TnpB [Nitrospirae bacterium]|nr:IS200/IS605 family element transposase accessory protein TnpB [Nitrospirota bacterium]
MRNNTKLQYRTYQHRLSLTDAEDNVFSKNASLFGRTERSLFARLQSGDNLTVLKREFLKKFGITARQFNSISAGLKGKIASIKEHRTGLISNIEKRIKRAKKVIEDITDPAQYHQKKRRLTILETKLNKLKSDKDSDTTRLCFGSRKLFRAQFHLKDKGYMYHKEWKKDWQAARSNQFFVIGSKDETAGCQTCVATVNSDGSIKLRLRLPDTLSTSKKYLTLGNIRFKYGHEDISASIGRNLSGNKADWQAHNYRFMRDDKGWRVFVSAALPEVPVISLKNIGVIGVDINANHLAVTQTDRFGNPVSYFSIPYVTYGKTKEQRQAVIGDVVKQVIAFAISKSKPIVIEKLDFQAKKSVLEKQSKKYARMLSSLAYTQIQTIIRARAVDSGIKVFEVNPAYTSVIGRYKFMNRYGMSGHNASSLVIGRRFLGLNETLPNQLHVTLPLSVRNRGRHVWSKWAVVSHKALVVPVAHRQSGLPRSLPSPVITDKARLETILPVTGEIPVCEPPPTLFG